MIDKLLFPVISLGGMGILFGAVLAYAAKKFAVPSDPKADEIKEVLPGANCGACGYPGCDGLAASIASGDAAVNACPVGGNPVAEKIAAILGVESVATVSKVAHVLCGGDCEKAKDKYKYEGIKDCVAASMLSDGPKSCSYGCLGLGTCERVCPFDAIHVNEKGIAVVDRDRCTGCNKCVVACPKNIIELIPETSQVQVMCMSKDKGKDVRQNCSVGCIGCRMCVKTCQHEAFVFEDNLARINYDKCVNCMECVEKCPTKAIVSNSAKGNEAVVNEEISV